MRTVWSLRQLQVSPWKGTRSSSLSRPFQRWPVTQLRVKETESASRPRPAAEEQSSSVRGPEGWSLPKGARPGSPRPRVTAAPCHRGPGPQQARLVVG